MILFEESIRSKYTKRNYTLNLNRFMVFAGLESFDKILSISQMHLQHMLEDYLIDLKRNTNPNSIPSMFRGIKHFCIMNRININWNIIYKMFPPFQKSCNLRAYTTKEVRVMLSRANEPRDKALIHFLASTGARVGVFDHALLVKHLQKMSSGCISVLLYADEVEEYWAFLTPQATKALNAYHHTRKSRGEKFEPDTPVFTTSRSTPTQLGWSGTRSVVYRIVSKCGIRTKCKGRFDVQVDHGFRKRFNTILKLDNSVNYNIAEKLMGHKNGMDGTYFTPSLEDLLGEFRKVMHKLEV